MIVQCTRKIQWCAGHRVMGHENKCANLHGHQYMAEFAATAPSLDRIGRVIDFSVLKLRIGSWIDDHWDHGFILSEADIHAIDAIEAFAKSLYPYQQRLYRLPYNPTAENLARYLLENVCPKVLDDTGVVVVNVRVHETPNCYADARLGTSQYEIGNA